MQHRIPEHQNLNKKPDNQMHFIILSEHWNVENLNHMIWSTSWKLGFRLISSSKARIVKIDQQNVSFYSDVLTSCSALAIAASKC